MGAYAFLRHHTTGELIEECVLRDEAALLDGRERRPLPEPKGQSDIIRSVGPLGDRLVDHVAFCKELIRRADERHRLSRNLLISEEMIGGCVLLRPQSLEGFGREQVERFEALLPHMVRALRLHRHMRRLERAADQAAAALDRLPNAAAIVSSSLRIIHLNRQAEQLLAACKTLRVRHEKLVPERAGEASTLRAAVINAMILAEGPVDGPIDPPRVVNIMRPGKLPLDVLAVPLRPRHHLRREVGQHARVMLLIYDPQERPLIDPELLERLFDLTTTEALVAAKLAQGDSITEIAEARRCSRGTVRTHVKRIFQKTHTNRQGELVQLILTSPAISFGE